MEKLKTAIYGAGQMGVAAMDLLEQRGQKIWAVLDRNAHIYSGSLPVCLPEEIAGEERNSFLVIICVAVCHFQDIRSYLEQNGYSHVVPCGVYICNLYQGRSLVNLWTLHPKTEGRPERNEKYFYDDLSKDMYRKAVHFFKNGWDHEEFHAYLPKEKYFPPEIRKILTEEEEIVDAFSLHSAYLKIYKELGFRFKSYYLFGAEKEESEEYAENGNIKVSQLELSANKEEKMMVRMGIMRPYTAEKGQLVCFDTLDHQMENSAYTYLRCYSMSPCLDILEGGIHTLLRYRPILSVNIGHYEKDFIEIPGFLSERLEHYRWLYRQHGYYGNDSILYGIPEERYSGKRKI